VRAIGLLQCDLLLPCACAIQRSLNGPDLAAVALLLQGLLATALCSQLLPAQALM
jgi:hypothetical protein